MINELISTDFPCVSCNQIFISTKAKLFCSPPCQQDAKLVRYTRACIRNGRINDPEVWEAINLRFAIALGEKGYYDENARKLSLEIRNKIIGRDNGCCRKCGKFGNEIDHINGDSDDLDNLQLLCHDCHLLKTKSRLTILTPEHPRYKEIKEKSKSLWLRINAESPQRICDDSENWNELQKQMMSEQWKLLKKIKEDIQGTTKQEDTLEKKLAIQEMNELAELESQLETLQLQKQTQIDQILTSEIKSKLEAVESDFADSTQAVRENIEATRGRIKENVLKHGETVNGTHLQAVWTSGKISWNLKALEEYGESHPEILEFRKEGTPFVSFRRTSKEKKN
jgi:5-methylcytosine-specific restriction endonuclease McrA